MLQARLDLGDFGCILLCLESCEACMALFVLQECLLVDLCLHGNR